MPTFYFDVYDSGRALRDEVGAECPDVAEAATEAAALLPEMAREMIPGEQSQDFAALVRDASGQIVYRAGMVFRGRLMGDPDPAHAALVSGSHHQVVESADLRKESRQTRERVTRSMFDFMSALERTLADVDGYRRAHRGSLDGTC